METWVCVVFVTFLLVGVIVVAAIADANKEAEEWAAEERMADEFCKSTEDVAAFIRNLCGRVYKDLDPRRKGRTVRVLDVGFDERGWVCSVLASPSGIVSDIRWDRLEDPARFERVTAPEEV